MHGNAKIEPIEERTGQSARISIALRRRATARRPVLSAPIGRRPAARTRIGGADEEEACRELNTGPRSVDPNHSFFERLSQRVQHERRKLTEFVEKQDAMMREGDLAGSHRRRTAAEHGLRRRGVVRRAQRRNRWERGTRYRHAGRRVDLEYLDRLIRA